MARRGDPELLEQLDEAAALDGRARELAGRRDDARRKVNELSKEVGRLRRDNRPDEAEATMAESRRLGEAEMELAQEASAVEDALRDLLLRIPNLPSDLTPDGA